MRPPCLQVMEQMPEEALEFLKAELDFFDRVTDISGELYPVPKDERKTGAVALAKQVRHSCPACPGTAYGAHSCCCRQRACCTE